MFETWEPAFTSGDSVDRSGYHRGLSQAFPDCVYIENPIRIDWHDVTVEISIRPLPDFSVGLVVLLMLEAEWKFIKGSEKNQRELLKKADRSMQRGLG